VLKKVFPVSEKTLFEVLTDSTKLQSFFKSILTDPNKREGFERELRKFLTGDYGGSFEEFQKNVKDTLGVSGADRMALEAYTQFTSIIYDSEILNKIIDISKASEDIKEKIEESFKEIHSDFEKNFAEIKNSKSVYYIMFHGSSGLNLLISKDIALFR
jgi:hypothetical protein